MIYIYFLEYLFKNNCNINFETLGNIIFQIFRNGFTIFLYLMYNNGDHWYYKHNSFKDGRAIILLEIVEQNDKLLYIYCT